MVILKRKKYIVQCVLCDVYNIVSSLEHMPTTLCAYVEHSISICVPYMVGMIYRIAPNTLRDMMFRYAIDNYSFFKDSVLNSCYYSYVVRYRQCGLRPLPKRRIAKRIR